MVFAEDSARWLLIIHALVGVAVVAASTHLAVWMRRFPRGEFQRMAAVRRFSRISLALYGVTFLLGNFVYPAYRVHVRGAFFDDGTSVTRAWEERQSEKERLLERYRAARDVYPAMPEGELPTTARPEEPPALAREATKLTRWFDVKEHWVALGFVMALAAALILHAWNPKRESRAIGGLVFGFALAAAFSAWMGAVIGLIVSSVRAVG